jgi:hypothetical protein
MVMHITLEVLIDAASVNMSDFYKHGMNTGGVDVLLRFRCCAEGASGFPYAQRGGSTLSKIDSMRAIQS